MGKLNMNAMKSKLEAESRPQYSNAEYDKLVVGKNVRRILWPKGDSESFFSEGYLHFSLGKDGKSVVTCPKTWGSKNRCPVCEYVEQLQKSKNKDDKKLANDIKATRRIYVNVLNRDDEENGDTPIVLPIGATILKGILGVLCDPDYGDITDPEEGRDITITRKGTGMQTEYAVLPKPKTSVASDEKSPEEIEEEMTDLEGLFIEQTYEQLEAVMNGEELESDDESNGSDEEDEEESAGEYDDLELDELIDLCDDRGLTYKGKATRLKLIALLENDDEKPKAKSKKSSSSRKASKKAEEPEDEEEAEEEDTEEETSGEEDEEDDDVRNAITEAINRRKKK